MKLNIGVYIVDKDIERSFNSTIISKSSLHLISFKDDFTPLIFDKV